MLLSDLCDYCLNNAWYERIESFKNMEEIANGKIRTGYWLKGVHSPKNACKMVTDIVLHNASLFFIGFDSLFPAGWWLCF